MIFTVRGNEVCVCEESEVTYSGMECVRVCKYGRVFVCVCVCVTLE